MNKYAFKTLGAKQLFNPNADFRFYQCLCKGVFFEDDIEPHMKVCFYCVVAKVLEEEP